MNNKFLFIFIILLCYSELSLAEENWVLSCLNGNDVVRIKSCPNAIKNTTKKHFYHKNFYELLGRSFDNASRFNESIQVYQAALNIYPKDEYFLNRLSLANNNLIEQIWLENRNKKINHTKPKKSSSSVNVKEKLNILRCKRFSGLKALSACNKAIKALPDDATLYTTKGDILLDLGKTDEAIKAYNKSLQLQPTDKITNIKLERLGKSAKEK